MRRLRDEDTTDDPVAARAAAMLAPLRPLATSDAQAARVYQGVTAPRRLQPLGRLRPVVVAVGVTLLGLSAAAALLLSQGRGGAADSEAKGYGANPTVEEPASIPSSAAEALPAPSSVPEEAPPAPTPERKLAGRAPPLAPAPASSSADAEGMGLLYRAARAARGGSPEEATRLLEQFKRRQPSSALKEEALALSIEAAARQGSPRAAQLARDYLSQYPKGRYRTVAERALSTP